MSSILDALEKLESRRAQTSGPEPPRRARRSVTPLLAGAAVTAFAAGIGITVMLLRPPPSTIPAPTVAPPAAPAAAPLAAPPAAAPPLAVAAPAPPATLAPPRPVEQPWAEVVTPPDARNVRNVADAPPSAAAATVARLPVRERPADRAEPEAAAVRGEPAPPPTTPPPAATKPAGAPEVRVSFLVYSGVPERRSVALTIDGGLVTLHEGEASNGVSVAEILPDGVELNWQGQAFQVPARD